MPKEKENNLSMKKWLGLGLIACLITIFLVTRQNPEPNWPKNLEQMSLEQRIEISLDLAQDKLSRTIKYLQRRSLPGTLYPSHTENETIKNNPKIPDGAWITAKAKFWSAGAFPSLLWKMYQIETDVERQAFWAKNAKIWGEPLRRVNGGNSTDMTINNLFVFQPWWEQASGREKQLQLGTILRGAAYLAEPYNSGQGRFHEDIGVMGYERKASRTDNQTHWQAFIDHTINVEQLLWATDHHPDPSQAREWRSKALSHIKTLAAHFGNNRNPGNSGTWQRGYFDYNPASPSYGQFLFNEGKQGAGDETTWSRGQAWFVYGANVTYQYTQDPEILAIAKEATDYFLNHLPARFPGDKRRQGDFVPPWDFDYALQVNPDTERDSSAAAIAVSGILKLIKVLPEDDPDRQRYLQEVNHILLNLTSRDYLATNPREMNLLRHGCYHHYEAIKPSMASDNGLIWGDYFFIDALLEAQTLREKVNN